MNNYFLCKVRYSKTLENGLQKKVTESYLVYALSFTEAEARIIEEMKPFISGEFSIADISRYPISELFLNENGDRFYRATIAFITLDERSGSERKTKVNMLCQSSDLQSAKDALTEEMKGTLADFDIIGVKETAIVEFLPYSSTSGNKDI